MPEIAIKAQLGNLPKILEFIREKVSAFGLSEQALYEFEVACEEALVNIILYAYPESPGEMSVEFSGLGDICTVTVKDTGVRFDPTLEEIKVDPDMPLESREEGGLGIYFMHMYTSKLTYERIGDENVLKLVRDKSEKETF